MATTTLKTLWMGIPLVKRVEQQFAARTSYILARTIDALPYTLAVRC